MKYTFSFSSSSGDEITRVCDAKTLDDALLQLVIFVYSNNLYVSAFSFYYYVDGKKRRSQRIFDADLIGRFWNIYRSISSERPNGFYK